MAFTDWENIEKWNRIKRLIKQGTVNLDDLAVILPGILHINNRKDFSFQYLSPRGCKIIGYNIQELQKQGAKIFRKHQSAFTREITHPKILNEFKNGGFEKVLVFYQDWRINNNRYNFFLTTTRILNDEQLLSISLFPEEIKNLTPKVNPIFGINRIYKKYFNAYNMLTRREKEILALLGREYTRTEIATQLYISEATIKKHCENIYRKLETHKRTELEKIAFTFSFEI